MPNDAKSGKKPPMARSKNKQRHKQMKRQIRHKKKKKALKARVAEIRKQKASGA